jgi:hypothetical protein
MIDALFYTKTMAKVYADQGNLLQASEIYRYLLKREPDRQDLAHALSEIQKKYLEKEPEDLVSLFSRWIELELAHDRLRKLKKLQSRLK